MVTFSQLQQVDLSSLNSAAGDFEALVRKWDLTQRMQNEVIGTITQSGWHGDAAGLANAKLTWARDQIHAAFEEASALAKALRDAHTEITAAKQDLTNAVHNATTVGLTVNSEGAVSWPAPTTEEDKRDPDYGKSWKAKADSAAKAIGDAIDRATEADLDAARALGDDTGSDGTAFNANPAGGIPEEEAKAATYILSLGDKASDAQLKHLQSILDHHDSDPRFATSFYGNQDPATFLSKYGAMAQSGDYANSPARSAAIKGIQKDLGLTLATATDTKQPLHVSDDWETKLRAAGAKQIPVPAGADPAHSPYGYQIMANLLRNGKYDPHFINPIAEHVTQLTEENPMRWDAATKATYPFTELKFIGVPDKDGNLRGINPMSAVLEGLGHSPEAATKFFHDPATTYNPDGTVKSTGGANTYLKTLTDNGTRSLLLDQQYPPRPNPGTADPFDVTSLGHALEAATTGRAYDDVHGKFPPHTSDMNAVMQQVVTRFGTGDGPDALNGGRFANLNGSLGNMTANYMGDIQGALEGPGSNSHLFKAGEVERLLGTLGRNPDAYASIAAGQQAYTTAQIQDVLAHPELHKDLAVAIENIAKPAGQVNGLITSAMVDAIYDKHTASDAQFNGAIDTKRELAGQLWSFAGDAIKERAPLIGEGVDYVANQIMDNVAAGYKVDTHDAASDEAVTAKQNAETNAQQAIINAVRDAGRNTGADPNYIDDVARRAAQEENTGYGSGRDSFGTAFPKK
ncbi:hypothetical protein [Kitasatospora cathayae]|uniref:WXG100 family type VII secretion target n=1 Tax=Kitasatospora cathayae TaxID=3004092 RepID=A0ABY7QCD9_9ACTN|nr:hypothetical protein [Kitasatospora sp. HUAS 3-15]WBP90420.1 hypothetical protein O1G21_34215 [Kitasatospora sp. HUAS 3-15]